MSKPASFRRNRGESFPPHLWRWSCGCAWRSLSGEFNFSQVDLFLAVKRHRNNRDRRLMVHETLRFAAILHFVFRAKLCHKKPNRQQNLSRQWKSKFTGDWALAISSDHWSACVSSQSLSSYCSEDRVSALQASCNFTWTIVMHFFGVHLLSLNWSSLPTWGHRSYVHW